MKLIDLECQHRKYLVIYLFQLGGSKQSFDTEFRYFNTKKEALSYADLMVQNLKVVTIAVYKRDSIFCTLGNKIGSFLFTEF